MMWHWVLQKLPDDFSGVQGYIVLPHLAKYKYKNIDWTDFHSTKESYETNPRVSQDEEEEYSAMAKS